MHHSFLDKFSDRKSPIHALGPRLKIVTLFAIVFAIVAIPATHVMPFVAVAASLVGLWMVARLPLLFLCKRILIISPFMLVISLSLLLGHRDARSIGIIILRSLSSITAISLLTSTTPFPRLLGALADFKVPKIFIALMAFLYRFTYVLIDEFERINTARKSRELSKKIGLTWRARANMIGTFFLRSIERSERVYQAMLSRGYDGTLKTYKL